MTAQNHELQFSSSASGDKATEHKQVCPACGSEAFLKVIDGYDFDSGKQNFSLVRCDQCHLVRTSPLLSETQLGSYYSQPYYGAGSKKFSTIIERWVQFTNRKKANSIRKLIGSAIHTPQVLDIGCGRAQLLSALSQVGCACTGVERGDFPAPNDQIKIITQDFLDAPLAENFYDAIILWHVLEHLSNPVKAVEKIAKLLKPSGVLIVAVPNFGSFQAKLFGRHWFHLDLPRHTYHFTPTYLEKILSNHGLTIIKQHTWTLDQSLFGFVQSSINTIGLFPPNSLYSLLKLNISRPDIVSILAQGLLGVLISSFALVEYIISGVMGSGSCIVIRAKKND